jgi:hypothetical protein
MNKLAVITTYYNPSRYKTRRINFELFKQHMIESDVQLLTVECTFGNDEPELPPSPDVIHLTAQSVLWQKERLLNIAAHALPDDVDAVAWIDADVLFDNPNWVNDTLKALDDAPIAQLFSHCLRQTQDGQVGNMPDVSESFASVMSRFPESMELERYDIHGHTGYAWAMRRVIFDKVGLYEHAISGSADHFMAHALFNNYNFCVQNALMHDENQISHLKAWGERFHAQIQGNISYVKGQIRHLWHGNKEHRNYFHRMHQITRLGYNPWTDLQIHEGAPIEWSTELNKTELVDYFHSYFASRKEDGEHTFLSTQKSAACTCGETTKKDIAA